MHLNNIVHVGIMNVGLGNIGSVVSALNRSNVNPLISLLLSPPDLNLSDQLTHLILPGVGTFQQAMNILNNNGWTNWIKKYWVPSEKPLLGICLGMQLLASHGIEGSLNNTKIDGLGLIPGEIIHLPVADNIKLPHIGWNDISIQQVSPLFANINDGCFYFVHSYYFSPVNDIHASSCCTYGINYPSSVQLDNIYGVQFHPEKSQRDGAKILDNFLKL